MSPQRPGGGDDGPDRPGDASVGRGEEPVDVDAAWADIVAHWGEPPADRGSSPAGGTPAAPPGRDDPPGAGAGGGAGRDPGAAGPLAGRPGPGGDRSASGPGVSPGRRVLRGGGEDARPGGTGRASEEGVTAGTDGPAGWDDDEGAPAGWRGGPASPEPEDDHYVPPEPPRSPPSDLLTRLAWVGAVAGPGLLLLCALVWRDAPVVVVGAAVAAFVAGFGVLVARLPRSRDDDDGAVV